MSVWTQMFLVNWITLFSIANVDRYFFNDKVEKLFPVIFGLWAVISWISIPVWLIYLVVA